MKKQIYYEDIEEGIEVTPLVKEPDTRQLVMWAGASGDYNPIHYDKDYALKQGLPGVIVQGQLVGSFLRQLARAIRRTHRSSGLVRRFRVQRIHDAGIVAHHVVQGAQV